MGPETVPVKVQILDKEYQVVCAEDETEALVASAAYVNQKMQEIRNRGAAIGIDRIAVITALNIAHELIQLERVRNSYQGVSKQLSELQQTVEQALQVHSKTT